MKLSHDLCCTAFFTRVPIVLVGNKSDLHTDRRVTLEQGKRLAEEMKAVFIETSAKENQVSWRHKKLGCLTTRQNSSQLETILSTIYSFWSHFEFFKILNCYGHFSNIWNHFWQLYYERFLVPCSPLLVPIKYLFSFWSNATFFEPLLLETKFFFFRMWRTFSKKSLRKWRVLTELVVTAKPMENVLWCDQS